MPKLTNQLPKKCNDRGRAFSWHRGKRIYHGVWGSPEADKAYKRFIAALLENPTLPLRIGKESGDVLVIVLAPPSAIPPSHAISEIHFLSNLGKETAGYYTVAMHMVQCCDRRCESTPIFVFAGTILKN